MKRALVYLIVGVLIAVIVLVGFFALQSENQITEGTINSDTTWSGTVNLTGNLIVNSGVRLTIQPGTTVNLNSSALQIDGTLVAMGNLNQKITFNGGRILFSESSTPWNEQVGSGCIIDNANSSAHIRIESASPKISNSFLKNPRSGGIIIYIDGGAPIIDNNQIYGSGTGSNRYFWRGLPFLSIAIAMQPLSVILSRTKILQSL